MPRSSKWSFPFKVYLFLNTLVIIGRNSWPLSKSQGKAHTFVGCLQVLVHNIHSDPPHPEDISSIRKLKMRHAVTTLFANQHETDTDTKTLAKIVVDILRYKEVSIILVTRTKTYRQQFRQPFHANKGVI